MKSERRNAFRYSLFAFSFSLPLLAHADVASSTPTPVAVSTPTPVLISTPAFVTMVHPLEGARLPPLREVFVFGAVVPGSTLTVNGSTLAVHAKGGYLAMVPLVPGYNLLALDAQAPGGMAAHLDRHITVAPDFAPSPMTPLTLVKESVTPAEDLLLSAGDTVRVAFQGTPRAQAEFAIEGVAAHLPMIETGGRGLYEGSYVIRPTDHAKQAAVAMALKRRDSRRRAVTKGRLTIDSGGVPRVGLVTDDMTAARTAADGGYDVFLSRGMRVRLTGKIGSQWRVRLSATLAGWVKESAIFELPRGTSAAQSLVTNITVVHQEDSTLVRVPLSDLLPYRVEQTLEPPALTVTLYGAADKTDLIRYDPADPLVSRVHWRQVSSDVCQVIIEPKFKTWWGFDARYEGSALVIEIRKPWTDITLHGMPIAVDAGHGGPEMGAVGPHGTLEKDANLAIARLVSDLLEKAGAKPFLTRTGDVEVPLHDRPRLAWKNKARLFVSVHCNASGLGENPTLNSGSSVYWNQPQSQALAGAIHESYRKNVPVLPDRGLFYADFAVCRMTQMPAVLTEQAYIILPEQEALVFDPQFQKTLANAIVNGIKAFVTKPQ